MQFSTFSSYLAQLEKTSLRNQMTQILAQLFKQCDYKEIDKICYLSLGLLAPKYEGIEFNMAEKLMVKAVAQSTLINQTIIFKDYKDNGDLGNTIEKFRKEIKQSSSKNLNISEVYNELLLIAQVGGEGSVERKINKMANLLKELDPLSTKYVVRMPLGKLRLGFSDMTILDSLSWLGAGNKSLRSKLERAFNVLADIGRIAKIFKLKGLKGIKEIKGEVGIPIRAAKAERLANAEKILEKMDGQCALEGKIDGFRVQIHFSKLKTQMLNVKTTTQNLNLFEKQDKKHFVRIFSRNLENTTHMFPEIVAAVQKLPVKSVILDGEAIAFNPKTHEFLPFQETVQRKRKHGVVEKAKEIPLKVFIFDILYLNGELLLNRPFKERRNLLEKILINQENQGSTLKITEQKVVSKPEEFKAFFKTVVNEGLEGLMAKKTDAVYQAGARNFNWVKYKVGMQSELADTIDCVVMGYYYGKGKRTTFGIGAFLVGIINDEVSKVSKGDFLTISKVGTGLTDEQWQAMFKRLKSLKVSEKPKEYIVDKNLYPDVWCQPELVVEIEADIITKSPIHTAGLALRFPRLKRLRDDKNADQATSLAELKKLVKIK